jgi:hypothetical protein
MLERTGEVTECVFTHGGNDISGCPFIREDNQAKVRPKAPDFAKKLEVLRAVGLRCCDDQVEGLGLDGRENGLIVGKPLNAPALVRQDTIEQAVDFSARVNQESAPLGGSVARACHRTSGARPGIPVTA